MKKTFWAHKTAEVHPNAHIGKGTKIWQNSQVLEGAQIGAGSTIGHNCLISKGVTIGNGVKIEGNTDVWDLVTLEDYVFVGPSAVFTNDPNPRAKYPKKKYPKYGAWKPTLIKTGASIGANATIVCGITIGAGAFIGAGSVVTRDVADYGLVMGVPARQTGSICECGNKLAFQSKSTQCKVCNRKYTKQKNVVKLLKY